VLDTPIHSILNGMLVVFVLLVFRILVRKEWLAALLFVALLAATATASAQYPLLILPYNLMVGGLVAFLVLRFGLLASVAFFTTLGYSNMMTTIDFSSWSSFPTLVGIASLLALCCYAFVVSLGGRPIFGSGLMDEA
jgi:hypothetical protein